MSHFGGLDGKTGAQNLPSKPRKDKTSKTLTTLETLYSQKPWLVKSKPPTHGLLMLILQDVLIVKS